MSFVLPSFSGYNGVSKKTPGRNVNTALRAAMPEKPNTKPSDNGVNKPKIAEDEPKAITSPAKKTIKTVTAKAAADVKTFTNTNKFVVPKEYREPFDAVWENRKKVMESSKGFEGLKIDDGSYRKDGNREITVSSMWKSIPDWEAYSCSLPARRSHLPPGIFQYVPKKGEGFPEDFTPFVDFSECVTARY